MHAGRTEVEAIQASDHVGDEKAKLNDDRDPTEEELMAQLGLDADDMEGRPIRRSLADKKGKFRISCITFKEWAEEKRLTVSALKRILFSLWVWFAYLWSMYGHTRVQAQFMVKDAITDDLMEIVTPGLASLLSAATEDKPSMLSDCGNICGVSGSEGGIRLSTVRDADDVCRAVLMMGG